MRSITQGLILIVLGAAQVPAGAGGAAADPAGTQSPEYWLARAQATISSVDPLQKPTSPPLNLLDLAMAIHEVSSTPERRQWIGNLAARVEAGLNALEEPLRRGNHLATLTRVYRVILADEEGYRRCVRRYREMIDSGQIKGVFFMSADDMLAHVLADAGDIEALMAHVGGMREPVERAQTYARLARILARMDLPVARRVVALALKEAESFQTQEPFKLLMNDLSEPYARLGEFDQAIKARSLAIRSERRPGLFATLRLMGLAKAAGNEAAYVALYELANDAAVKGSGEDHLMIAGDLVELNDSDRAAAQAKQAVARFAKREVPRWDCVRLATVFARVGDKAAYRVWIDRAQVAVDKIVVVDEPRAEPSREVSIEEELGLRPAKPAPPTPKDKARGHLSLAAPRVYGNEMEFMHRHVKAANDVPGLSDADLCEERYQLISALRKTGRWDDAEKQIDAFKEQTWRDSEHCSLAYDLAAAGLFDAAERQARKATQLYRMRAWFRIARDRAKAGKLDGLEKWVDELESPMQRAAANVYIAHTLAGTKHGRYWWMLGDQ